MNCIIPFEKEIKFKTNIAEILSISLEHDYTLNDCEILGNFTILGDYKSHEVSINKEHFEYVLPFQVNLTCKIDEKSINFDVEDFTYEVINNDTLKVKIEYSIKANELEEEPLFKEVNEPELDKILDELDEDQEREIPNDAKETIINNVNTSDETYVTYKIHEVKETDTIESICMKYNVSKNILSEYNDISNLVLKDKLLIPEVNE